MNVPFGRRAAGLLQRSAPFLARRVQRSMHKQVHLPIPLRWIALHVLVNNSESLSGLHAPDTNLESMDALLAAFLVDSTPSVLDRTKDDRHEVMSVKRCRPVVLRVFQRSRSADHVEYVITADRRKPLA